MQILTLHREPSRRAFFDVAERRPVFFEKSLGSWVVSERDDAEAVLQSRAFQVVSLADAYEGFQQRAGNLFPNLIFALRHIPLGLNDEAHRDMRKRLAELIVRRRSSVAAAVPELVEKWLAPVRDGGEVELVDEVLAPLVIEFVALINETGAGDLSGCRRISLVFDRMLGMRTRLALEAEVGAARAVIRASIGPDAPEVEEGMRLALFALGNDALVGTLGESIYRLVDAHPGVPLNLIEFPEMPVETGVPFVERLVVEPVEIGGFVFEPGQRVRVLMQSFAYSPDPDDRARMFGAGVHACLGRQLALDLWRQVAARLSLMTVSAEVVEHRLRDDNYVFTCPAKLLLRISP